MRRSSEYALGLKSSIQYQPVQSDEAVLLAYDLIHSSKDDQWKNHIFRYVIKLDSITNVSHSIPQRSIISSIISLVYNLPPITSLDDPTIAFLLDLTQRLDEAMYPGNYVVEFFPLLDLLPPWLVKWKREAVKDYERYTSKFESMFQDVKSMLVS